MAAASVAVVLAAREQAPPLVPLLVFAALHAFTENQSAEVPNGIGTSALVMLTMGAIVVFQPSSSYLGVMLASAAGGLYLPVIRDRDWRKLVFNSSMLGLAALAAAAIFWALVPEINPEPITMLMASIPAAIAYAVVNLVLLSSVISQVLERPFRRVLREALGESLAYFPFALLGVFLGTLYVDYGALLLPLFIAPILIARQTYTSYLALKESQEAAVRTLIGALEAKDPYTAGHAERVANYAQYIGQELGMSPSRLERLRFAALMHDVGKLVVPNHLLNKKGKLTAEEFTQVRLHEEVSVEILTRIDFLAPVAPSATSEAAEFAPVADDRGQPIEPHIVAVADAFDAMTSTRSYRRALPQDTAFMELRQNSGKQFHPRVVDALIIAIERRGEVHGRDHEIVVHHEDAPEAGTGSAGLGDLLIEDAENGSGHAAAGR